MSIDRALARPEDDRAAMPPPSPSPPARHSIEHTTGYDGGAERGYRLIADVTRWPVLFPPCLAAQVLESDRDSERIRLWAVVGKEVSSWTSLRKIDEERLRVDFRQETPNPPLRWMSGHWLFEEEPGGRTRLVLGHEWSLVGTAEEEQRIADALHRNSEAETAALARWAGRPESPDELLFTVRDEVVVGAPPRQVYDFLYRADRWPERIPHVAGLDLEESDEPGAGGAVVQTLDMSTRAADGSEHITQSVRLCFPYHRIAYKQTTVPRGLLGHSGEWVITAAPEGTRVTALHRAALDPEAVEEVFGPGTTLATARDRAGTLLSTNSLRTLEMCRAHTVSGADRTEEDA
ncbi:aromatase [Streptomyces sp. HUCO-GS316]|uniref:aromatase/cyclase n=1 Tax=Streptomyces sp. HUCO-GS316 TaxID=2692198 RepID=UPI00136ED181|nr:aromatase/cyclase [Streptomyces sp. HUCO-GS316]MXM68987.1 aromatase [Streptomyces sp. HUCO-GS316]